MASVGMGAWLATRVGAPPNDMEDVRFTKEIVGSVTEIKNETETGEMLGWDRIVEIFLANKIATRRTVDVNHVMVHPENRGRL